MDPSAVKRRKEQCHPHLQLRACNSRIVFSPLPRPAGQALAQIRRRSQTDCGVGGGGLLVVKKHQLFLMPGKQPAPEDKAFLALSAAFFSFHVSVLLA